jgi:hypothetical protein
MQSSAVRRSSHAGACTRTAGSAAAPGSMHRDVWALSWPLLLVGLALSFLALPNAEIDSVVLLAYDLPDSVIPHFSPGYPYFTRTVAFLWSELRHLIGVASDPLFHRPNYGVASVVIIVAIQHAALVLSAAYLAWALVDGLWSRRIVLIVLYLNPIALHSVHSLLTEGLFLAALYALLAEMARIVLRNDPFGPACLRFCLWLTLATLLRHTGLILGAALPAAMALRLDHRRAAAALAGVGLVWLFSSGLDRAVTEEIGAEPRTVTGRNFIYRIAIGSQEYGYLFMTAAELEAAVRRLKAATSDARIIQALEVMHQTRNPWVEGFSRMRTIIETETPGLTQGAALAETDRRLNAASIHAIMRMDAALMRDSVMRTVQYLAPQLIYHRTIFPTGAFVPASAEVLDSGTGQFNPKDYAPAFLLGPKAIGTLRGITHAQLEMSAWLAAAALIGALVRRGPALVFVVALLSTTLVYAFLSSVVAVWSQRYSFPLAAICLATFIAMLASLPRSRPGR